MVIGKTGESQTVQSKVGKKLAEVNAAVLALVWLVSGAAML